VRVEEDEPGVVGWPDRVGVDGREQRESQLAGSHDVEACVEDEGGRADHGIEDALHRGPDPLRGCPAECAGGTGGADQIDEMCPLRLVQLQRASDAVDDALGDAGGVAALELCVVLARDAGQEGDLVAAQARDPSTLSAIGGQTGLLGADPGPSRGQKRLDLRANAATGLARDAVTGVTIAAVTCHTVHPTSG
jgi:hypothetical protein